MSSDKNGFSFKRSVILTIVIIATAIVIVISLVPYSHETKNTLNTVAPTEQSSPDTVKPSPSVTLTQASNQSPLYANCAEVWKKLGRPITKDDEGFPKTEPNVFDLDADGIGCEDNPNTPENEAEINWADIWEKTKNNGEDFGKWAGEKLNNFWNQTLVPFFNK